MRAGGEGGSLAGGEAVVRHRTGRTGRARGRVCVCVCVCVQRQE